jgi:glyoxylase-like metal-dependent hydrolase (beta-lactamase superfamily II)
MSETDKPIERAIAVAREAIQGDKATPVVKGFFDPENFTISYIVHDPATAEAAIVDSVWDFDEASGRTSFRSADAMAAYVHAERLTVDWLLETHAHADHLSAAPYLQEKLGGKLVIGRAITAIQEQFGKIFNEGTRFARDGSQFDRLLDDGDELMLGSIPLVALHVPGHTPADMAYLIGDALFAGDTMFMPDYGSARADFPGGCARQLYRSVRRLMQLPDETRAFMCHDYKAPGRDQFAWETTIGAERTANVHLHEGVGEEEFVAMRTARDKTLGMPKLILPSLQVNMRGGRLPEPEDNGVRYMKLPIDSL